MSNRDGSLFSLPRLSDLGTFTGTYLVVPKHIHSRRHCKQRNSFSLFQVHHHCIRSSRLHLALHGHTAALAVGQSRCRSDTFCDLLLCYATSAAHYAAAQS